MNRPLLIGMPAIDTRRPDKLGTFAGLSKCGRYAVVKYGKRCVCFRKQFLQRRYVGAMA